jgi:hypothetical protein
MVFKPGWKQPGIGVSRHTCRKKAAPAVNCIRAATVGKRKFKEKEWLVIVVPSAVFAGARA